MLRNHDAALTFCFPVEMAFSASTRINDVDMHSGVRHYVWVLDVLLTASQIDSD